MFFRGIVKKYTADLILLTKFKNIISSNINAVIKAVLNSYFC